MCVISWHLVFTYSKIVWFIQSFHCVSERRRGHSKVLEKSVFKVVVKKSSILAFVVAMEEHCVLILNKYFTYNCIESFNFCPCKIRGWAACCFHSSVILFSARLELQENGIL